MKATLHAFLSLVLLLSLTGCLKTRAQLKEDGSDTPEAAASPQPVQVKEVAPQGQYAIDEIKSEITRLTGRIDDLERNHQQQAGSPNGPASKEDLKKLETRIIELEQAQANMLEAIKKFQNTVPAGDAVELFEKGRDQFQAKEYEASIENFSQYLKNPKGKNTEDALFLRGEAYYQLKQFKKAIIDFSKFPEKYHHSKKLPAALYKIGLAFDALGMKDDAKGFYQELVEKFPKSPEAKKAKSKSK